MACNLGSVPLITNGFTTYFSDNDYAWEKWNNKAKDLPDCFVALNGVCSMKKNFCSHFILMTNSKGETQKCWVIDFCDPKNCDFLDSGHLGILNNDRNSHSNFVDLGKNMEPYAGAGDQQVITWHWSN